MSEPGVQLGARSACLTSRSRLANKWRKLKTHTLPSSCGTLLTDEDAATHVLTCLISIWDEYKDTYARARKKELTIVA